MVRIGPALRALPLAGPGLLLGMTLVLAGSPAALAASCFSGTQAQSAQKISDDENAIKADAAKWFSGKGGNLTSAVRDLAGSDPDFAATIVNAAKNLSSEQAAAIGAGLGQATAACSKVPADAAKIQAAAATAVDPGLLASFNSTTGGTQTADIGGTATGGGGGGANGGAGGTGSGTGPTSGSGTSGAGGSGSAGSATPTTQGVRNSFVNLLTTATPGSSSATQSSQGATTTSPH